MPSKAPIKELIDYLIRHGRVEVPADGCRILVELGKRRDDLLTFQVVVYQGEGYIPPSVRACLTPAYRGPATTLKTSLVVSEELYSITLHFSDVVPHLSQELLILLLDEFGWLAEEWRRIFDDHDKRDLVHVRVK